MKIRGEIRTKKSLNSVKKNINPSIIRYDKNIMNKLESTNTISSVNGGNYIIIFFREKYMGIYFLITIEESNNAFINFLL